MSVNTIIKTPLGEIEIGPNTTPSSGGTVSVEEIGKRFAKIANKQIIDPKNLEDESTKSPISQQ